MAAEAVHPEENSETLVNGIQSSTSVEQKPTIAANSLVKCPPSFRLLPPAKSKRRAAK